ncbi:hypothetical protein [Maridesulfovibrio ferrireducens]|uniref:hypothetical protein n=1 Tax=Maridesulfovibrio ferrireducens TaxID=246191 RepID=UPI001A28E740|nr:hypothetical protein [Maridesulfovibrio ferrireducens]MBI9112946.1 hypothetical protein [Maridesulfovibrio ferrireducens]
MADKLKAITIKVDESTHRKYKMYLAEYDKTFKDIFMEEMERRIKEAEEKKKEK